MERPSRTAGLFASGLNSSVILVNGCTSTAPPSSSTTSPSAITASFGDSLLLHSVVSLCVWSGEKYLASLVRMVLEKPRPFILLWALYFRRAVGAPCCPSPLAAL